MSLLDAALALAARGFHVFPTAPYGELNANGKPSKEPKCAGGHLAATTDEATIRAWWAENPDFNIGCAPALSGLCVLDVDPPLGDETLAALGHVIEASAQVRTPRGGRHYWFAGHVRTSTGDNGLGSGLDTRGGFIVDGKLVKGGFVVVPPSRLVGGDYTGTLPDPWEAPDAPSWMVEALAQQRQEATASAAKVGEDEPINIARAVAAVQSLVARGKVAVAGANGDHTLHKIGALLGDFKLSEATALDIFREHFNPHCSPPWNEKDLPFEEDRDFLKPFRGGLKTRRENEPGAKAIQSPVETFAEIAKTLPRDAVPFDPWKPLDVYEQDLWEDPSYLLPGIPERGIVVVYGRPGTLKSFLLLHYAMTLAQKDQVLYFVGESPGGMFKNRKPAWQAYHKKTNEEVIGFYSVGRVPRAGEELELAIDRVFNTYGKSPKLIILDTLTRAMSGYDLNKGSDVSAFIAQLERLRDKYGVTFVLVHHSGKGQEGHPMGATAIEGSVDAMLEVRREKKSKFVFVDDARQKEQEEGEGSWFRVEKSGKSIVLVPSSKREQMEAEGGAPEADDTLTKKSVVAALRALEEAGAKGVSTDVLAHEMTKEETVFPEKKRKAASQWLIRNADKELRPLIQGDLWYLA